MIQRYFNLLLAIAKDKDMSIPMLIEIGIRQVITMYQIEKTENGYFAYVDNEGKLHKLILPSSTAEIFEEFINNELDL